MKLAISSQGNSLDAELDPRFGRANCFLLVDTETMQFEVVQNSENANSLKGAGIQTATMINDQGGEVVITGYCGPKAYQVLEAAGIPVVTDAKGSVGSVVQDYIDGKMAHCSKANAESHW